VKERILRAYFTESLPIGEPDVLARLAAEAGLAEDEAIDLLAGDAFADAVRADERRAAELGIGGVPFFVVDDRYAVSGAQSTEHFLQALTVAWDSRAA
jgi:predicted DsbA family dithiol-disulfide isomerase